MNGIYLYFVNKHCSRWPLMGLQAPSMAIVAFAANVIQDQAAHTMQPYLGSTLSTFAKHCR